MKYHLTVTLDNFDPRNAADKAVRDCTAILASRGYQMAEFSFSRSKAAKIQAFFRLLFRLTHFSFAAEQGSLIVCQYPVIGVNRVFRFFARILRSRRCFLVCIIHDLNSIRYQEDEMRVKAEVARLNAFDVVISHNSTMTEWLRANGVNREIVELELFDYLHTGAPPPDRIQTFRQEAPDIVFAGSLGRGKFIYTLHHLPHTCRFLLYGPVAGKEVPKNDHTVLYRGSYPPDELVSVIEGHFGLIWDGDSVFACEGGFGLYLEYNNPHKASLYLAAGLPLVVPAMSAIGRFVVEHNIGILVDNLASIGETIRSLDPGDYAAMVWNVLKLRERLIAGDFLSCALEQAEALYEARRYAVQV
ncbi:MAG TPA: hypothetical protein VGE15_04200 [Sphingobacteriaceae bacterium]